MKLKPIALATLVAFTLAGSLFTTPAHAFDEDHLEKINNTMLHFRVRGSDKTHPYLLILHGGPGFSAHMFYTWGPSLEKTVNVVYLDQRGCGQSQRYPIANPQDPQPSEVGDLSIENMLSDIEGVRKSLGVEKWYVLGHSWGGMLGIEYIAAHPEHVIGFIDMDGLVSVPRTESGILNAAETKFKAMPAADSAQSLKIIDTVRQMPDGPIKILSAFGLAMGPAGLYFPGDQQAAFASFYTKIRAATAVYNIPPADLSPAEAPTAGVLLDDNFATRDDFPLVKTIKTPTLIINGNQDGVVQPDIAQDVHTDIAGSTLVLLDNCGHFPFADQPDKTTAAILSFIAAQP